MHRMAAMGVRVCLPCPAEFGDLCATLRLPMTRDQVITAIRYLGEWQWRVDCGERENPTGGWWCVLLVWLVSARAW